MRNYIYIFLFAILSGCDTDSGIDCFKLSGDIFQEEIELSFFDKVNVGHRVQLFIKQGTEQHVILETGENMRKKVTLSVSENRLHIENGDNCNLVRDYGITKVFITVPDLSEIRNSSGLTIEGQGVLAFPDITLLSEDTHNEDSYNTDGDFILDLQSETLTIVANGISNFFLSGTVTTANLGLYSGDSRLEAQNLIIEDLTLFHRSSNKMFVNPQQSIRGEIRSTGDVISLNQPPIVEVEEFYTGRLIFQ
tara:strand:- start:136544 stop:137293 length:750 start_codon:yes stop_codon:yes gene_type:complete